VPERGGSGTIRLLEVWGGCVRANDTIVGFVLIVLALTMIVLTANFPAFPGQKYGPSLFPRVLGTGVILCGILIIVQGLKSRRAGAPWLEIAPWVRDPWRATSFLLVLAMLLFYIFTAEMVGFIPIAIVFLGAMFLWLGVRPLHAAIIAPAATLVIFWFFATMLRVPLPRGILTNVL
jgi:putative tricarboxylic transport membrane protein